MTSLRKSSFQQKEPLDLAIGELSKMLDNFSEIEQDRRRDLLEDMKGYPYLTNLNMEVMASVLTFMVLQCR